MYRDNRKRTKWMIPLVAAALILPFSTLGNAAMADEPMLVEDAESINQPGMAEAGTTSPSAIGGTQTVEENAPEEMGEGLKEDPGLDQQPDGKADGVDGLTYSQVYEKMIALRDDLSPDSLYSEGKPWTNFYPYGTGEGNIGSGYKFRGGPIKGASSGVGCAAFAFILSDAAFGDMPARAIDHGSFKFEDVKVGDILRVNNNSHFVIVLQKSAGGVTVAEGNYNKSVHWGRAMSAAEVEAANFIITRYPEGFVSSDDATANEVVGSGQEESLNWTLTKAGTLKITGDGAMPDYSLDNSSRPAWEEVPDASIQTIVIDKGVTGIGECAFYNSTALSVYISDSVEKIGQSAFRGAQILNVTIPGSVKTIGNDAFRGGTGTASDPTKESKLMSVTVSEGVESIGERAFRSCNSLGYIDFPASITSIGSGAFTGCLKITRVRFMPGSGTVEMGENLFSQCQVLTSVTLPQTVSCISVGMFHSCTLLSELYIPKSVQRIEQDAFNQCTPGMTISFGGSETEWKAILSTVVSEQLDNTIKPNMRYNQEFVDPFADIPGDPGDFNPEDTENPGENPGETTPPEEPAPEVHEHNWAADWASDENNHWHECGTQGCPVTDNSQKDSYGAHTYGSWVTDKSATSYQSGTKHRDCTVCLYRQSGTIPATGSSSSGGSSSGGGSWSSGGGSSWSPGGGYWNPGSSYGGSNNTGNTENKDDTDKTDSTDDAADNNAGNTDSSSGESDANSNGTDNNAGSVDNAEQPENNTNDASTSVDYSKVKKQLKTEMKTQMKATMKTQIKKEMKPQLKAEIKKLLKKQAQIKPKAKAKLKTQLKKQLKQELKAQLKATLKAQLKKEFGKQLGDQFIEEFNTQFNKQFNALYNEQFNKQFHTQYKQLTS